MTKRRRRKYRSESSQSKKTILIFVLCILGSVLLALLTALIIGNALKEAAMRLDTAKHENEIFSYDGIETSPVNASLLSLEGQTDESIAKKVEDLPSNSDVSICIRNDNGTLLYRSNVAFGVNGSYSGNIDLERLVTLLHKKSIHVSAICFVRAPSNTDVTGKEAAIEYESSLIAEAFAFGIDDIVLTGLPSDTEGIATASRLFAKAREKCEKKVIIGAALSYKTMLSSSGAYAVENYCTFADVFAIDMSSCRSAGFSHEAIATQLGIIFKTYPIRVLIDFYSESDRQTIISKLNSLGIYNIQAYKQSIYTASTPAG